MKKQTLRLSFLPLALACLCGVNVRAEEPKADAQQASALMKNAQAFVEAFEKGDAKAVAGF